MAAATVGRFCRARARLVGARVESAELCMDTIGLHAQFGGFAQPLRPPSPSSAKPVEPPPLGRHRGGSLRCVKKGAALRRVIAMVVGLAAATRRRRPYPSSEQRTRHPPTLPRDGGERSTTSYWLSGDSTAEVW